MKKSLLEILKNELKLDFSKILVHRNGGIGYANEFDLEPRDFLRFAKNDFSEKNDNGLINSLTNAKRAIDCQIDSAFTYYGIKYDKLPKVSNEIVKCRQDIDNNLPFKLQLITALDFAPSYLASKVRGLRNKLEHFYQKPNEKEVKDSIELAELFILAVESKTKIIETGFIITDFDNFKGAVNDVGYYIKYDNYLAVELQDGKIHLSSRLNDKKTEIETITEDSAEYYFFVQMMNNMEDTLDLTNAFKILLEYIGHPIPAKHINVNFQ